MTKSNLKQKCYITIEDEVTAIIGGLHPTDAEKLYEKYAIFAPSYFFHPKFKLGTWDGKIRYFQKTGKTYVYLLSEIVPKLIKWGYSPVLEDLRKGPYVTPEYVTKDHFAHRPNPKDPSLPHESRYYQVEAVNELISHGGGLIVAATSAGKAQGLDNKVLTPTGWKRMGDIAVGDVVVTPKNTLSNVIGVYPQGKKDLYKITFDDGSSTECCLEHLWKCDVPINKGTVMTESRVVDTAFIKDWLEQGNKGNIHFELPQPINLCEQKLLIDPYLLGALLGDGGCSDSSITFTNIDQDVLELVNGKLGSMACELRFAKNGKDHTIRKIKGSANYQQKNAVDLALRNLMLRDVRSFDKFIPHQYLTGSYEQRLALIRGLMDTDGTIDKRGNCSLTTTSRQLASDVCELARSLGMRASVGTRNPTYTYKGEKKQGRLAYDVQIRSDICPFVCSRKSDRFEQRTKFSRRWKHRNVVSVEFARTDEAQCIMLDDEDHLYITDDYLVTHNTTICSLLVDAYGQCGLNSLTIVPDTNLVMQTMETYEHLGLDVGEYTGKNKDLEHQHIVGTWQTIKNHPHIMTTFGVVIVDEVHKAKSKVLNELVNIYGKNIPYRFGMTGTLPKDPADALTIQIAFGDIRYEIPAEELIEEGYLSSVHINMIQLFENHPDGYFPDYASERSYLVTRAERLDWIAAKILKESLDEKGNVMCLVSSVSIGKKLAKLIPGAIFLHGKDDAEDRKKVYDLFATNDNMIVIATVHIAGTGLSIDRIFKLFLIDIGKSFTRVIQAIGRGLRKGKDKDHVEVFDISSTLKYSNMHKRERIKYYKEAKYPFTKKVVKYRDYAKDKFELTQEQILAELEEEISLDY